MLSKREKLLAIATGSVVAIAGLGYFVFAPILSDRDALRDKRLKLTRQLQEDQHAIAQSHKATLRWKDLRAAGLSTDASATESTLLNALGAWSQDSRLPLLTEHQDRVGVSNGLHDVTFQVTASGTMHNIADFIYRAETTHVPAHIHELQLAAKNENTDDLEMQLRISTLWEDPKSAPAAPAAPSQEGSEP